MPSWALADWPSSIVDAARESRELALEGVIRTRGPVARIRGAARAVCVDTMEGRRLRSLCVQLTPSAAVTTTEHEVAVQTQAELVR
jgi:hypothetical protein